MGNFLSRKEGRGGGWGGGGVDRIPKWPRDLHPLVLSHDYITGCRKRGFVDVIKLTNQMTLWLGDHPGTCLACSHMWDQLCLTLCNPMDSSPPAQDLLSMGFSRKEYWNGFPFLPSEDLPKPGIEPSFPVSPALTGRFFTTKPPYPSGPNPNFSAL